MSREACSSLTSRKPASLNTSRFMPGDAHRNSPSAASGWASSVTWRPIVAMVMLAHGFFSGPAQTAALNRPPVRVTQAKLFRGRGLIREEHEAEAAQHRVKGRIGKSQGARVADASRNVG